MPLLDLLALSSAHLRQGSNLSYSFCATSYGVLGDCLKSANTEVIQLQIFTWLHNTPGSLPSATRQLASNLVPQIVALHLEFQRKDEVIGFMCVFRAQYESHGLW